MIPLSTGIPTSAALDAEMICSQKRIRSEQTSLISLGSSLRLFELHRLENAQSACRENRDATPEQTATTASIFLATQVAMSGVEVLSLLANPAASWHSRLMPGHPHLVGVQL